MRIKVPERRHDRSFFTTAQQRLAKRDSVTCVEVNPATGSILLYCSDSRALLQELEKDGAFVIVERLPGETPSLDGVRRQLHDWESQIQRWTGMRRDVRVYVFFALIVSAAYQLARGNIFAPAATLIWYASEALRVWGERGTAGREGAAERESSR